MDPSAPPAYSDLEFDQKTSTALDLSLSATQYSNTEEEWEEWDDTKFEAAAQALYSWGNPAGSGPSNVVLPPPQDKKGDGVGMPSIKPLRVHKKSSSTQKGHFDQPHEREDGSAPIPTAPRTVETPPIQHQIPSDDEEDRSIPPPPFSPVSPSADGTPIIVMSYQPSDVSRSASPLIAQTQAPIAPIHNDHNPALAPQPFPYLPSSPDVTQLPSLGQNTSRFSRLQRPSTLSPPPSRELGFAQRPLSSTARKPTTAPAIPRMSFDPSVAYGHGNEISEWSSATKSPAEMFDANAFYNSAVSAYLVPSRIATRQSQIPSNTHYSPQGGHDHSTRYQFGSPGGPYSMPGNQAPTALPPGARTPDFPAYTNNEYSSYQAGPQQSSPWSYFGPS